LQIITIISANGQNQSHAFPVDGEVAKFLPTYWQVGNKSMEFGKRHDTTDTTDFCPCLLINYGLVVYVADLLREVANLLYGLATGKLV